MTTNILQQNVTTCNSIAIATANTHRSNASISDNPFWMRSRISIRRCVRPSVRRAFSRARETHLMPCIRPCYLIHALANEIEIGKFHFGERIVYDRSSDGIQKPISSLAEKPLRDASRHHGY